MVDVLMVLHALMVHSKAFAEDCLRHRKIVIWNEAFPLEFAWQSIDSENLTYTCTEASKTYFQKTGLAWDNIDDPEFIFIECFRCRKQTQVPWTTRRQKGIADDNFQQECQHCKFVIRKNSILVQKLRRDLFLLLEENIPLPGTYSSAKESNASFTPNTTSNELFSQSLRTFLLEETRPTNLFPNMDDIIASSAKIVGDKHIPVLHDVFRHYQYMDNSSCNLHAAVTRVLESASTLHTLDLSQTNLFLPLSQTQYISFLRRHSKESRNQNTDDIASSLILLWRTHQLASRSYCEFSQRVCNGVIVDWEPVHLSTTCSLCYTLQPPSFTRRFLRGITSLEGWKEYLSSYPWA